MSEYMMDGSSSGMMIVMALFCLMFVALLVLSIAALVKYLFASRQGKTRNNYEGSSNA